MKEKRGGTGRMQEEANQAESKIGDGGKNNARRMDDFFWPGEKSHTEEKGKRENHLSCARKGHLSA